LLIIVQSPGEDESSLAEEMEALPAPWRGFADEVVCAFPTCGDLSRDFARVYCDTCRSEFLRVLSCTRRGVCLFCPRRPREGVTGR
jgi:hypothetical protein